MRAVPWQSALPRSRADSIQGSLNFTDNAGDSPQPVSLSGTAVSGGFAKFTPSTLVFPPVASGASATATVTLTNTGTSALGVTSAAVQNIFGTGDFQITQDGCSDGTVQVNATCAVTVKWTNGVLSLPESDQLIIQDDAQNGQQIVALVGGLRSQRQHTGGRSPLETRR